MSYDLAVDLKPAGLVLEGNKNPMLLIPG